MRRKDAAGLRRRAERSKQDVCDWKPNPLISKKYYKAKKLLNLQ